MMLLRARTLAMGCSGARPVVAETIARAAQRRASRRSCPSTARSGASGDLAPLAHCALVADRRGRGRRRRRRARPAAAALGAAGIAPLDADRQGGPRADQRHRRHARHARARARTTSSGCCSVADVTAAMAVEALLGTDRAFAADLVALRPQPGQAASAANLRALLAGSPIVASHRYGDDRVQDAYSLRCAPQVHGAARDTLAHARARRRARAARRRSTTRWCCPTAASSRAATSTARRSAFACDFLAIAVAEVGAIAERRTDRLLDPTRSHGLPPFLADDAGRQLRADDRPLHAGRDGGREPPPGRAGERRLAARRARCRRTTCRWAGARRASSARRVAEPRAGSSPSS